MASKGKTRLKKLVVDEVSLVDRGANGKRFLLTKRAPDMTVENTTAETVTETPAAEVVADAVAETVEKVADVVAETVVEPEVAPETITKALADAEKAEAIQKAVAAAVEAVKAEAAEAVQKALDERTALEKRLADAAEAAEVAESIQKAASTFKNVPVRPEQLGPDLRRIRKADAGLADRIETLLKQFDAVAAGLLKPVGSAEAEPVAETAWEEIQKRAGGLLKAGSAKTMPEAISKVMDADKSLYERHEAERNAQR